VEGVQPIRNAVFTHFCNHFKKHHTIRPGVGNMNFKTLTVVEGGSLVKPFTIDEVRRRCGIVIVIRIPDRMVRILVS